MATFRRKCFRALFTGFAFLAIIALLGAINVKPPAKRIAIIGDSFALLAPWDVAHLCVLKGVSVAEINLCVAVIPLVGPGPTDIIIMAGPASLYLGESQEEVEQWLIILETTVRLQFPDANIYPIPLSDIMTETIRNPRGADLLHMAPAGYKALRKKHLKPLGRLPYPLL